jgi:hypothetical protein
MLQNVLAFRYLLSTVSHVINKTRHVDEETRNRVLRKEVRRGEEKGQKYQMIQEEFQILERVK